jgi:hypothetical protein
MLDMPNRAALAPQGATATMTPYVDSTGQTVLVLAELRGRRGPSPRSSKEAVPATGFETSAGRAAGAAVTTRR